MHKIQADYVKARAEYEAALKMKSAGLGTLIITAGITEDDMEELIELEIEADARHGVNEKMEAMLDARDALFAWAKATVAQQMAGHPGLDEALGVFDRCRRLPSIMEKVIETTLRLEV